MTRRFFGKMVLAVASFLPLSDIPRLVIEETTHTPWVKCGPLSPIRKTWKPLDIADFTTRTSIALRAM